VFNWEALWKTDSKSSNVYEVLWATAAHAGESVQFKKLDSIQETRYSLPVKGLPGRTFKFKIRPRTGCGEVGKESPELFVKLTSKPEKMAALTTKLIDTCSVKIKWTSPNDGGLSISKYKVEVCYDQACNSIIGSNCQGLASDRSCLIPFWYLFGKPFNVGYEKVIQFKI